MPTTSTYSFPYPSPSDPVDVPADMQALADAVDTQITSTTNLIPVPNRNVVINGAMQVAQRGTSTASITTSVYATADRWYHSVNTLGTWTSSVENDAPTGSGFRKSLKVLCTTADAAPSAADYFMVEQRFEGQNVQHFLKGTSSAKQYTVSFWVKSNVTGTYIVELRDADNARWVSASYSVTASATWEKKTLTLPADTTGLIDNDNGESLLLTFWLATGSNYGGGGALATTWNTTSNTRTVGQTNVAAAINNYWQVTGVQLEAGSTATAFEFEPYDDTLRKCQRYYWQRNLFSYAPLMQSAFDNKVFAPIATFNTVPMRATPTVAYTGTIYVSDFAANLRTISSVAITSGATLVSFTYGSTKLTSNYAYAVNIEDTGASLSLSIEL